MVSKMDMQFKDFQQKIIIKRDESTRKSTERCLYLIQFYL